MIFHQKWGKNRLWDSEKGKDDREQKESMLKLMIGEIKWQVMIDREWRGAQVWMEET